MTSSCKVIGKCIKNTNKIRKCLYGYKSPCLLTSELSWTIQRNKRKICSKGFLHGEIFCCPYYEKAFQYTPFISSFSPWMITWIELDSFLNRFPGLLYAYTDLFHICACYFENDIMLYIINFETLLFFLSSIMEHSIQSCQNL
jgi:hypothetical protein